VALEDTSGEGDDLTASLLANNDVSSTESFPFINGAIDNSTIWQSSITESHFHKVLSSEKVNGSREIDIRQISTPTCVRQVSSTEVAANKLGMSQVSLGQVGIAQISPTQIGGIQEGSIQIGIAQISPTQIGSIQISSVQISATQIDGAQIDFTKVSLPSSITLQQFLSSHNFSLQNTTIPTWTEFLTGTTPFNLNIAIANLPPPIDVAP
jgi:hypothetical protein